MRGAVLVTGAGTGLGLETSLYLAQQGATVYASVLTEEQQESVRAEAARRNVQLHCPILNVQDNSSIQDVVKMILATSEIMGVVHNAGISLRGYFEDCDDDEIRRVIDINLFGAMNVTRAALPPMRQARHGRLIFVSSIGGRIASMARTAYCASKFALEGFAESLMQEVLALDLHVSIIEPAIIKTERWTVHRGIARRALEPASPYVAWFQAQERLADTLADTSPTRPIHVAQTVYKALTARKPKLRYVVGRRAGIVLALRRYTPGELFERFYFGEAMRRVTADHNQTGSRVDSGV